MDKVTFFLMMFSIGVIGHLIMRRSADIGVKLRTMFFNGLGEGEAGAGAGTATAKAPTFTPEQQEFINNIVAKERKATESRYNDYEDLRKFKTEFEKSQDAKAQQELENAKKYDEAKKTYESKITDLSGKLTAKEQEIQNIRIDNALGSEISRQGGYTEESLALIKANATVDASGNVVIKAKDNNGLDITIPVADGVKKFLTERPHLVRSNFKGGSGSGGSQTGGQGSAGTGGQGDTLESLNAQLADAMRGTNLQLRSELRSKIKAKMAERGIQK